MMAQEQALKFGLYLALVGIGVTFGSLIFLYFILRAFLMYQRSALKKEANKIQADKPLPDELAAVIGVAIEKYLKEEQEYLSPPLQLEFKKPSAWKISGRSET